MSIVMNEGSSVAVVKPKPKSLPRAPEVVTSSALVSEFVSGVEKKHDTLHKERIAALERQRKLEAQRRLEREARRRRSERAVYD